MSSPLLEEVYYYPFGLTMSGISDRALQFGKVNKYRFQNQELQSDELSDHSGLDMYEFKYRFDDPQIGRFWSVDPLADKYVYNSTYAFSENKVISYRELEGLEANLAISGNGHDGTEYALHPTDAGAFASRAARFRPKGHTVKQVQNGQEFVQVLKDATEEKGSVGNVAYFGHTGGVGLYLDNNAGFYTGGSVYSVEPQSRTVNDLKGSVDAGDVKFDKSSTIIFGGCNTENPTNVQVGEEPLAISFTQTFGVTTYGATGEVYPEKDANGNETGRLVTDGTFMKNTLTTSLVPVTTEDGQNKMVLSTTVTQVNVGNIIDPMSILTNNNSTSNSKNKPK